MVIEATVKNICPLRNPKLHLPTDKMDKAMQFLDSCNTKFVSCCVRSGFLLLLAMIMAGDRVCAQPRKLPPFRMVQADDKLFKAEQLPFGKPVVIVYFLPDCQHCQRVTRYILKHVKALDKASVVMVTYYPTVEVGRYARKYGLDRQANFYLGTEGNSFFLKNYYGISKLPFMALYTKNGDMVKTYSTEQGFADLLHKLKNLN